MTAAWAGRRLPLRVKLVATLVALLAVGLTVSGVVAATALRGYLLARVDSTLADPGRLAALTRRAGGPGDGRVSGAGDYYEARYTPDGRLDAYDTTQADPSRLPSLPAFTAEDAGRLAGHPFTVPSVHDRSQWRAEVFVVGRGPDTGGALVVAIGLSDVQSTEERLAVIELAVGAGMLALLAVAGFALVRSSLRPLEEVEGTARAIAAGDLSRRVPEQDPRTEVGRLSLAFNSMLARIEDAFAAQRTSEAAARESEARMRRFVADASHELRTPLTSIRGFAELYRMGAVTGEEALARNLGRVEAEAARMGALVEDLLLLARLDQQRPLERRPVDLVTLAADAVHDAQAASRDHTFTVTLPEDPVVVTGDESRLRQVFANLVSNAVTHTPPGTSVEVRVSRDAAQGVVAVGDDGPGLAPGDAGRVFERFFRVDASRTRAHGGSGLGLSIVAGLVAAHGGEVDVRTSPGEGAVFEVRLPLQEAGSAGNGQVAGPPPST